MATLSYNKQKSPWRDCDITELGLTLSVHGYLNVPLITVCLQQVLFITLSHYASN